MSPWYSNLNGPFAETCHAGANSGVGYAATQVIARASPDFEVIMAGRSLSKIHSAQSEIEAAGVKGRLSPVQLDVTDEASVDAAAAAVRARHGRLDVLINNAAVGNTDPDPRTRFRASMDTNVLGPYLVAAAFNPLLLKSENPYSIYVSSGAGSLERTAQPSSVYEPPNAEGYRASKAALNMVMVMDWKRHQATPLKVFGMCPGFVVSNLRGTSEEERTGRGQASDPQVSGQTLLSIIEGKRDGDQGRVVHKDGVHPW